VSAYENEFREWWQQQASMKDCHDDVVAIVKSSLRAAAYEGWLEGREHAEPKQPDVTVVTVLYDALRSAITWLAHAEAVPLHGFAHTPHVEYLRSVIDGVENPHALEKPHQRLCTYPTTTGVCNQPTSHLIIVNDGGGGDVRTVCERHAEQWASTLSVSYGASHVFTIKIDA
jgi:hypothetical protein